MNIFRHTASRYLLVALLSTSSATALAATPAKQMTTPDAPSVASGAWLTGLVAARQGDHAVAATALISALDADPTRSEILRQAFLENTLAETPEALSLAERLLKQKTPHSMIATLVIGNDAARHGNWQEALRSYKLTERHSPSQLLLPFLTAWCLAGAGNGAAAINTLTTAASHGSPLAPFYLTHAALIAGFTDQHSQEAFLWKQASSIMPGTDMLLVRGKAAWLWQQGKKEEARAMIRQATKADSLLALATPELQASIGVPPITSALQGLAQSYLTMAALFRAQAAQDPRHGVGSQEEEASSIMLHMALSLDPTLTEARLLLAEIESDHDHNTAALALLKQVTDSNPLNRVARFRRALLEEKTGEHGVARQELENIIAEVPQQILPIQSLASLLFDQADYPASATMWSKAIALTQGKDTPANWPLLFGRAAALEQTGDWPAAEKDLRVAREQVPNEPLILNFLGYGWIQHHQNQEEACDILRQALMLDPDDTAIRDSLGWALLETGHTEEAIKMLEQAAEENPEDPEINYHLGVAYWKAGRRTEAIDQWNVASGLKPAPDIEASLKKALEEAHQPQPDAGKTAAKL